MSAFNYKINVNTDKYCTGLNVLMTIDRDSKSHTPFATVSVYRGLSTHDNSNRDQHKRDNVRSRVDGRRSDSHDSLDSGPVRFVCERFAARAQPRRETNTSAARTRFRIISIGVRDLRF